MIIGGRTFDRRERPHVFGVVNLSPESPNKDSIAADANAALERAQELAQLGAEVIDVGAQSSYFDAPLLPVDEEIERLLPAVRALKSAGFLVSVDTFRSQVASAAIEAGADVINDSDGFQDSAMVEVLRRWGGPIILPFISGASPHDPVAFNYDEPMSDILPFLKSAVDRAHAAGLHDILLDPGTGYRYPNVSAEEKEQYQIKVYAELDTLKSLGHPLLVALPRKDSPLRTLELVRVIAQQAEFVRSHDPLVLLQALESNW
jgi:dihydropteroate synthase